MMQVKPGDKVWVTRLLSKFIDKCSLCNGKGYTSSEDDYGGYRSSRCRCSGGLVTKLVLNPGWSVDEEKKEVLEVRVRKDGIFVVVGRRLLGGPPCYPIMCLCNMKKEEISINDVFSRKSDAIKSCKEKNS